MTCMGFHWMESKKSQWNEITIHMAKKIIKCFLCHANRTIHILQFQTVIY